MAVASSPAATAVATTASKTKAKQRYLKRKKERKKHRKTITPKPSNGLQAADDGIIADEDDWESDKADEAPVDQDEEEASDDMAVDEEATPENANEKGQNLRKKDKITTKTTETTSAVPRKRRKLDDELTSHTLEPPLVPPAARTPTPPPLPLPSFPAPVRPDAPSKLDLALQGIDQGLVEAEIIDPASVQSIATDGGDDNGTGISDRTRKRLAELGITELFAVQTALLPFLLPSDPAKRALYLPYSPPCDACVSAPTGSGKTLAYVLPIIEILSKRIVTRLRALVVLPTRDLVTQVRETFEAVGKGHGLKIGTASGQHSFAHEQTQLVADRSRSLQGGSSKVDILICTPGRLIDHLNGTPNFSLQHLRFLVIDEADRLLAQSFQDWLAQVLSATRPPPPDAPHKPTTDTISGPLAPFPQSLSQFTAYDLPYHDAVAPAFSSFPVRTDLDERRLPSCQKLLFSATLTRDPGKLRALDLHEPRYFIVQGPRAVVEKDGAGEEDVRMEALEGVAMERFTMPATLREHMLVCQTARKPLMLFHLVRTRGVKNALVFTKSADSTTRLVKLFDFFAHADASAAPVVARAYSSDLPAGERRTLLERFKAQEIDILICSDLVARGIDIAHVAHVVSYDAPVDMRKYVHRVGRTARAGREGDAWTLLEEQEARYFKTMMKEADHLDKIKRVRVGEKDVEALLPAYERALAHLKDAYARTGGST